MNIIQACHDPKLFGKWFEDRPTFAPWFAFLSALFALEMDEAQLATYQQHTGRGAAPTAAFSEAWLICGRRAGKSFVLALCAVYLACFRSYRQYLMPGERATVLIVATDRKQARTILRYIDGFLTNVPLLKKLVIGQTAESFELSNSVIIEVGTSSMRSVRGYTFAAVLFDEIAYFPTDDSADPDHEIIAAIRPGTATIPNAMLLFASSPHAKRGALYDTYREHYGKETDKLVWKATTRQMNATIPQALIDKELEKDAAKASAEYLAEFRDDLAAFVSLDTVRACVLPSVHALMPHKDRAPYFAFVDPSGGSSDSMTLAIAHHDGQRVIIDHVAEERPPFSPDAVVAKFATLLGSYGLTKVTGDNYGSEWVKERFRKYGITYQPSPLNRSQLYLNLLPALNSGGVQLLDHDRAVNQIASLERRVLAGGREAIDHPPGSHDDVANVIAGVVAIASRPILRPRAQTIAWKAY